MKRITSQFLLPVGALVILLSGFVLYRTYATTRTHLNELMDQQAALALEFDLAIRKYVAQEIRPRMEQSAAPGEFVPETMSTSFVARSIFEMVRREFPDYIIKFSSDNPRNPANQATPDELQMIAYFNAHPDVDRWNGVVELDGKEYFAQFSARRMKESCLRCHGVPADAPTSLVERYGAVAGFHRPVGEVVALDTIAIPMDPATAALSAGLIEKSGILVAGLVLFFGAVVLVFRLVVTRRLAAIGAHFEQIAAQPDSAQITTIDVGGRDEISVLAGSFNTLAEKLRTAYAFLERRVTERTEELASANDELKREIVEREQAENELKESLQELERHNRAMLGREQRILEFKNQVNCLLQELGRPPAFGSAVADESGLSQTGPGPNDGRDALLSLTEDAITARNWAEQYAREAEAASVAKSEFLANMSHEIRTPMTAIMGFTDVLIEHADAAHAPQEWLNAAEVVKRNGEYLLSIVNDILDLSKIEAGKMTVERIPCSPCELVAEVVSLARVPADAKALPLEVAFEGPVPETIQTDPTRLRQILINVISNAVKFTEVGRVRIITRLTRRGNEDRLQFDVVDTGVGMNDEQVGKLFQPFTQADASTTRQFGGTGLGLVICKRLAKMLGGDILVVETRTGAGTRVRVSVATGPLDGVPMIGDPVAATQVGGPKTAHPTPADIVKLNGARILLAEDGPDNQRLITHVLRKAGARITVVENGERAMATALKARDEGAPFDVILMDMQMPVMDGYEAARRLRQEDYAGHIIALTAHAMDGDRDKCTQAGCDDYATKPIDRAQLLQTIQRGLQATDAT